MVPVPVAESVALVAVKVPVMVIAEPEPAVSAKVIDDGLLVVLLMLTAAESVIYTLPAEFIEIVGALVVILLPLVPIVPVPEPVTKLRVPVVDILVEAA